jgi:hypothetical protein
MVIEVFVTQRQALNALTQQFLHAVLHVARVAVVDETIG